jgi:hypothetical protein
MGIDILYLAITIITIAKKDATIPNITAQCCVKNTTINNAKKRTIQTAIMTFIGLSKSMPNIPDYIL